MRIEIDFSELEGFEHWAKTQPRLLRKATGQLLTRFAWGTRDFSVREIQDSMIVRNDRFVRGRLRVTQARQSAPTSRQVAMAGSVATARFTGWREQETGERDVRNRFATALARGGNEQKQIRHIARLKPRNEVVTRNDYGMGDGTRYTVRQFFAAAHRKKENRLIRVGKVILKRRRNRFEPVQILDRPKAPRHNPWLRNGHRAYARRNSPQLLWNRILKTVMTAPPKS